MSQFTLANLLSAQPQLAPTAPTATAKPERKLSEFFMNFGIVMPGAGENGTDLFISMPGGGIGLDHLEPIEIKGKSPDWVALQQAKNNVLTLARAATSKLQPGERKVISEPCAEAGAPYWAIEIARVNKPEQVGTPEGNSLIALMTSRFGS